MTDALPTPPASPGGTNSSTTPTPESSRADLTQELDALLERYLNLLDKQQNLHDELGKSMSSGFLSLARANQSCPPGRWYGQDYYDERMKAVRRIEIIHSETEDKARNEKQEKKDEEHQCRTESQRIRTPVFKTVASAQAEPPTPDSHSSIETPEKADTEAESTVSASEKPRSEDTDSYPSTSSTKTPPSVPTNPLRWFGILVPPSLRAAHGSFTSAVEGPVPALVSVIAEMREVEDKVDRLRSLLSSAREEREMVA